MQRSLTLCHTWEKSFKQVRETLQLPFFFLFGNRKTPKEPCGQSRKSFLWSLGTIYTGWFRIRAWTQLRTSKGREALSHSAKEGGIQERSISWGPIFAHQRHLKLEIWPQSPRYFAVPPPASVGAGVAYLWGVDFSPYLVDGQGDGIHGVGVG